MGILPIDHQRRQAGSHLGRGPGQTGEWPEAKLPINGQDARWPHRQDARATMASPQHALAILAKAEKAIANESWSQISRVRLAIACARNRGLPKPGKEEEDDETGNETGQSETGAGIDRR